MDQMTKGEIVESLSLFGDNQRMWIHHPKFKRPLPLTDVKVMFREVVLCCKDVEDALEKGSPNEDIKELASRAMEAPEGDSGKAVVFVDGACSGNPGPGGWAYLIQFGDKEYEDSGPFIGSSVTNNQMEVFAAFKAVHKLRGMNNLKSITMYSDSQYLVNTMRGVWTCKNNHDFWIALKKACEGLDIEWIHCPRESDARQILVDRAAKSAIRRQ